MNFAQMNIFQENFFRMNFLQMNFLPMKLFQMSFVHMNFFQMTFHLARHDKAWLNLRTAMAIQRFPRPTFCRGQVMLSRDHGQVQAWPVGEETPHQAIVFSEKCRRSRGEWEDDVEQ